MPPVGAHPTCSHPRDAPGGPRSQLGSGLWLWGGRGVRSRLRGGAYPAQTRSPARPGCREKWPDRGSSCRAREGPDSARGGGRREEGESVALAWPTPPAAPTPARIPHPRRASPIPKRGAGVAQHRCLPGPWEQRGWRNQAIFSPQLDLIFSSDAPTAGGGMAAEKQVRQGKAGRWQQAAGRAPARPCAAAGLIRH